MNEHLYCHCISLHTTKLGALLLTGVRKKNIKPQTINKTIRLYSTILQVDTASDLVMIFTLSNLSKVTIYSIARWPSHCNAQSVYTKIQFKWNE